MRSSQASGAPARCGPSTTTDVVPDILVVGKNLSGGIEPCAGIAARDDILGDNDAFLSGSTFAGTPAGCAAGIKTLEIFKRDGVVEQAARLGDVAQDIMSGWERYDIVRQVRSNGLLMGVSFKSPDNAEEDEKTGGRRVRCGEKCSRMAFGRSRTAHRRYACIRRSTWTKRCCARASRSWKPQYNTSNCTGTAKATVQHIRPASQDSNTRSAHDHGMAV